MSNDAIIALLVVAIPILAGMAVYISEKGRRRRAGLTPELQKKVKQAALNAIERYKKAYSALELVPANIEAIPRLNPQMYDAAEAPLIDAGFRRVLEAYRAS